MTDLSQPHDRFFRHVFSQRDIVEDILIENIPSIQHMIQPGSLEICKDKFISTELHSYASDLLLKAKMLDDQDIYFYLLLEHKSYNEPQVAFQLLRYMIRIWEKSTETSKPLPFIFPVVIYHGKHRWNTNVNFSHLVTVPSGMNDYVPSFQYYLYDLSQFRDEEIQGKILSRVSLLLFKHIFDADFGDRFVQICELLREIKDRKTALEYLRSVLEYIANASDTIDQNQVKKGVQTAMPPDGGELMPTLAEQFRAEGRQEGLQAGIQLALELKYGQGGLDFYQTHKDQFTIEHFAQIEDAIRNDKTIQELEQLF